MDNLRSGLEEISAIRTMMERATKFLSLSGLSGIGAGIIALAGAGAAYAAIHAETPPLGLTPVQFLVADALLVLVAALGCSTWFSVRMARRKGAALWGPTTGYLLAALFIPLAAGGAFTLILLMRGFYDLLAGAMLLFYGLALLGAANFTFGEIRYLGAIEILLGLTAELQPQMGLALWAGGFGVLHIVYGILLYARYEK